ncbi:hypothetical protein V6N13_128037 [Hibiscus sabdariffa]
MICRTGTDHQNVVVTTPTKDSAVSGPHVLSGVDHFKPLLVVVQRKWKNVLQWIHLWLLLHWFLVGTTPSIAINNVLL